MKYRLDQIKERIAAAAGRVGRSADAITLIAVTKTHPPETIARLFDLGQMDVGENRLQEMSCKMAALNGRGRWHFIGHLQRNKAHLVLGKVELIHSVDSSKLIEELEKRAAKAGLTQRILLELNLGRESAKTGAREEELPALLSALALAPHLRAEGLMTIPLTLKTRRPPAPILSGSGKSWLRFRQPPISLHAIFPWG